MPPEKRILIIDDEIDLCLLLKEYFQRKNYEVSVSHTLKEGRQMLEDTRPDILFLDNNLPDGVGWNLAPAIATDYPSSYIVLISAFHPSLPDMPTNAKYRTIEKPITMSDLDMQFANL
jgi:DNA-binding response OmpR family regulator